MRCNLSTSGLLAHLVLIGACAVVTLEIGRTETVAPADTVVVGFTHWDYTLDGTSCRRILSDSAGNSTILWVTHPQDWHEGTSTFGYNIVSMDNTREFDSTGCQFGAMYHGWGPYDVSLGRHDSILTAISTLEEYPSAHQGTAPECSWTSNQLVSWSGGRSPRFAQHRHFTSPFYHVIARSTRTLQQGLIYWRTPLGGQGRVVEPLPLPEGGMPYTVVASQVSAKASIGYIKDGRVYYCESLDSGRTWGPGPGFGFRHDIGVTGAGHCIAMIYDYDDGLHIVYGDLSGGGNTVSLRHWSAAAGLSLAHEASWEHPGVSSPFLNVNHPQLAVGTGSSPNNLYLVWGQFGTAGSGADISDSGALNGDIYMAISIDGGQTWDSPRNLTNTQSPGCVGDCASEVLPSIDAVVDSFVRLTYVKDLEAGPVFDGLAVVHTTTLNPVYHWRFKTPEQQFTPIMSGSPGTIGPLYFGVDRADTIVASIRNVGSGDLYFTFRDTLPWLGFSSGGDSISALIPAGSGQTVPVAFVIDAAGFSDGWHHGEFTISSNDSIVDGSVVNVDFLVSLNVVDAFRFGTSGASNCWGWIDEDGTEYALVGTAVGVSIVDATNLRIIDTIPGPGPCGPTNRDIKTYRHYAYQVSECTGLNQGLMVIDLQYLPDSAHLIGSFSFSGQSTSHNISIDTARGFAYLIGLNGFGFRVISLSNPELPASVGFVSSGSTHDLFARRDTVWVAEPSSGSFSIWNLTSKSSPVLITRVTVPGGGAFHNIWPSNDGRHAVSTEETPGKTVKIWNTEDLQNIQLVSEYLGPSSLAHNAHYEDSFIVIAHYETGVRVLDVSNPSSPLEIGAFDTWLAGEGGSFEGCWGVYPHTRSGRVYASNMDGTLFILQFPELLSTCGCDCHADPVCDGTRSDVVDVVGTINVAFRGNASIEDPNPGCPFESTDTNCSGATDIVDVVKIVNVAFRGATAAAEYCIPCP